MWSSSRPVSRSLAEYRGRPAGARGPALQDTSITEGRETPAHPGAGADQELYADLRPKCPIGPRRGRAGRLDPPFHASSAPSAAGALALRCGLLVAAPPVPLAIRPAALGLQPPLARRPGGL